MSDKHKHEWMMMPCSWNMQLHAVCTNKDCDKELDSDEIERRLNAVEVLEPQPREVDIGGTAMTPGKRIAGSETEILIDLLKSRIKQIEKRGMVEGSLLCVMCVDDVELTEPDDEVRNYKPSSRELFSATWKYEREG